MPIAFVLTLATAGFTEEFFFRGFTADLEANGTEDQAADHSLTHRRATFPASTMLRFGSGDA